MKIFKVFVALLFTVFYVAVFAIPIVVMFVFEEKEAK
jgi:hypothetical protein